jgi:hypothetical protein
VAKELEGSAIAIAMEGVCRRTSAFLFTSTGVRSRHDRAVAGQYRVIDAIMVNGAGVLDLRKLASEGA